MHKFLSVGHKNGYGLLKHSQRGGPNKVALLLSIVNDRNGVEAYKYEQHEES